MLLAKESDNKGVNKTFPKCLLCGWVVFLFWTNLSARSKLVTTAPASAIAAGKPFWVDSETNPEFALINARVDIGTLRQEKDEIEAQFSWPLALGSLLDTRRSHPGLTIPEGSRSVHRERVVCGADNMVSFEVEETIVSPDGKLLFKKQFAPAEQRRKAEEDDKRMRSQLGEWGGYNPNPRSLVCWAAARKCENKPFSWPPPPNNTPLERSDRAQRMNAQYNRLFVPGCKL